MKQLNDDIVKLESELAISDKKYKSSKNKKCQSQRRHQEDKTEPNEEFVKYLCFYSCT